MKHSNQNFANPLQLSKMSMKQSRNAFKMSYHENFSSPVGQIIPCHVQDVCPGDYVKLNVQSFARTVPCNTAAFARMTEHVDFYFVPYHMLWRPFKQLINPVPDVNSALSLTSEKSNTVTGVPYFTAAQVASMFTNDASHPQYTLFGLPNRPFAARLFDMLSYYSDSKHAYLDKGDNVVNGQDNTWINNFNNSYQPTWKFNPFRILAFNRILSDFYRATDYVQSNPRRFNIDDLDSGAQIPDDRLRSLFHCIRSGDTDANTAGVYSCFPFAKWHLDRLISVKPSQLYGNFIPDPSTVNSDFLTSFGQDPSQGTVFASINSSTSDLYADTQTLRIAQSIEKIGRLAMSAPKTFRAQQAALFGESSPSCDNCTPRYLGSYDSSLDISEVTATSAYEGQNSETSNYLGEVGGKGTSANQKNGVIKFKAEDFGVIMGVHYIVPDAEYQMNRYNRHCCKLSRSDFFNPVFDKLGLQPLYRGEVILSKTDNQTVVGMQARYMEYKSRENEIHGNFQRGRTLQAWSIPRNIDFSATDGVSRFYVHPDVSDSLFKANYDGTEVTDQFYCHYYFDQTIVQNKSAVGLPIL